MRPHGTIVCLFVVCLLFGDVVNRKEAGFFPPIAPPSPYCPTVSECDEACQALLVMSFECSSVMVVYVCVCEQSLPLWLQHSHLAMIKLSIKYKYK